MLVALMYHYVHGCDDDAIFSKLPGIGIEEFENQIQYMLKNFTPVTHDDLVKFFRQQEPLPKKSFYLTFDDGFKQHSLNVLPILKKYDLQGSFFVPTMPLLEGKIHFLEKQRVCQYSIYDEYSRFLQCFYEVAQEVIDSERLSLIQPTKRNVEKASVYLSQYSYYNDQERFYRWIRDEILSNYEAEAIIEKIFIQSFDEKKFIERYYMNLNDLQELDTAKMTVGAHSHSHPHLENLDDDLMKQEIDRGLQFLKTNVNKSINSFSYPFGTYDGRTVSYLQDQDVDYSFTTQDSINDILDKRYEIKRVDAASFDRIVR